MRPQNLSPKLPTDDFCGTIHSDSASTNESGASMGPRARNRNAPIRDSRAPIRNVSIHNPHEP
eukprot:427869-Alexandrium_andersonii.AAC.1